MTTTDPETSISLQPGQPGCGMDYDVSLPLPYPIFVGPDYCAENVPGYALAGREPDRDKLPRLVGFQRGAAQRVVLYADEWHASPDLAVGLHPVFADLDGGMFALAVPITSVSTY